MESNGEGQPPILNAEAKKNPILVIAEDMHRAVDDWRAALGEGISQERADNTTAIVTENPG